MPADDFLLGCGCRRRCCCGQKEEAPAPAGGNIFMAGGKGTPPPRLPDETPFIPTPASFDSPQLPGAWGTPHQPEVTAGGVFDGSGGGRQQAVMIRDDGTLRAVNATRVDHQTREVMTVNVSANQTDLSGAPDPGDYGVPSTYAVLGENQDPRVQPYNQGFLAAGVVTRTWLQQTIPYPDGPVTDTSVSASVPGAVATGMVARPGPAGLEVGTVYWRDVYWELRAGAAGDPDSLWERDAHIRVNLTDDVGNWLRLQRTPTISTRAGFTVLGEPVQPNDLDEDGNRIPRESHRSGRLTWTVPGGTNAPATYPDDPGADRWVSPDGRVRVAGPITSDHADLEPGGTLTAYGATFTAGTWAALCGPPDADGHPEAWIVHEAGGTVTLITPDGQVQATTRAEFETQVLRVPAGSLNRWASVGHLSNSWPPHWAVADVGNLGYRAVILHDPWRDSRAAPPPPASTDPPEWSWPARPRRRPATLPLTAPGALLALTLADVFREPDTGGPVDS